MRVAAAIRGMLAAGLTIEQALIAVEAMEQANCVRSSAAERQKRYRERQKSKIVTSRDVTPVTNVTLESPPIKETSPRPPKENYPLSSEPSVLRCDSAGEAFSEFFDAYPRRSGSNSRKNAETRFRSALKAGVPAATIIDGAKRYAEHCRATGNEGTAFVKMAEAWINGRLWESDYSIPAPRPPPPRQARRNTALDGLDELERRFSNAPDQHTLRIAG